MSLIDSVAAALEGRSRLLVFDNCEHVLNATADVIEAILARSATVKILATSREGLRVVDEKLWLVPSLEINDGIASPAAALFVERAADVAHDLSFIESHDANTVVEICRRLDGIPLAIELAASRMVSMTPTELRDRLDDRFRLLVGSRRGLERHHTLRHTVQWSYDLLDTAEQTLFNRCSVFAGGFDLAAACSVAGSERSRPWTYWTRSCASHSSWLPEHPPGHASPCWRPSGSSRRNNFCELGPPKPPAPNTPNTSPRVNPP